MTEINELLTVQPYVNEFTFPFKIKRAAWIIISFALFKPTPRWPLNGWRIFLLKLFGATIGRGCRIDPSCRVWAPWNLTMGDYSCLGPDVDCYSMSPIRMGAKVTVSQRSFLCTGTHEIHTSEKRLITKPIELRDFSWIAAEVFVHPGVTVGEGAVIGARSVVLKDMPSWMICAGFPCKPIKPRVVQNSIGMAADCD